MAEILVGQATEFDDDARKIVTVGGREVVVFKRDGRYYALDNHCFHQGGPVGEGILLEKVEAVLGPDKTYLGERFAENEVHLVCPWHGWEYDIETGACAGDPRRRLRKYQTVQREDGVYVIA